MSWPLRVLEVVAILAVVLTLPVGMIWFERRLLAAFQDRYGPNRVGPFGLLQPVADAIKLFLKEDWTPPFADRLAFVLAPGILVVTVLLAFGVVPFAPDLHISDLNVGLLFFLGLTSLGVYSIVLAGWASNSKYSLIGGMRAAAQMISYEIPLGLSVLGVVLLSGSLRLGDIVEAQRGVWFCVTQPVGLGIFLIATLAEARRIPFDLPEADAEIIAGYHTEYSSMKFGAFFLGEYLDILLVGCMTTVLFLGGWHGPVLPGLVWFALKTGAIVVLFILVRATLPRFRFDQLMHFGWKVLIPISLANVLVTGFLALYLQ
jgi:NADH-quinone oxidoreductase subunit H